MPTTKQRENRLDHAEAKTISRLARKYGFVHGDDMLAFLKELLTSLREGILASTLPRAEQTALLVGLSEAVSKVCEQYATADRDKQAHEDEADHERTEPTPRAH